MNFTADDSSAPIDYVAARARRLWRTGRGIFGRPWSLIGLVRRVDVVYVEAYERGDWERAQCTGAPARTWAYREGAFASCDATGPLDDRAVFSSTPVVRYCVAADGQRMIYTEWHGARHGMGTVLARDAHRWRFTRRAWRS